MYFIYFSFLNVRVPVTFLSTTVVEMTSWSPVNLLTVFMGPHALPFVIMTKTPSSMKSSLSTSVPSKSEKMIFEFFENRISQIKTKILKPNSLLCLLFSPILNSSLPLITLVEKSTLKVLSSGNEKVTVVVRLTAIFRFAQPRPSKLE